MPIDRSEPTKFGKRCTFLAVKGSWGRLRHAVCVEVAVVPAGSVTVIGFIAGEIFVRQEMS